MSVCRAGGGVKRASATLVSLARNWGRVKNNKAQKLALFLSKSHYPSFSSKMWLCCVDSNFWIDFPKKTHGTPKKWGDKNTLKFEIWFFFQRHPCWRQSRQLDLHVWPCPELQLLGFGKNCGLLPCFFFASIQGPGTCASGERTVTSRMGCFGIVQGDFRKKGDCPKKGN